MGNLNAMFMKKLETAPYLSKGRRKDWRPAKRSRAKRKAFSKIGQRKGRRLFAQQGADFIKEAVGQESYARRILPGVRAVSSTLTVGYD